VRFEQLSRAPQQFIEPHAVGGWLDERVESIALIARR
jgi:hypothetical protein